jgi:DNA-binding beta-propeller fold protein YncE
LNGTQEADEKALEKKGVLAEGVVETHVGSVIPEETWGISGKVGISFVRTIGDAESKDPNLAFYYPNDLVVDAEGNILVLDSENHRIQKFSPKGTYLETIGREGEGPLEFSHPWALDIDRDGNLVVNEPDRHRLHIISPDFMKDKFLSNVFDYSTFEVCCHPYGGFVAQATIMIPLLDEVPLEEIKCLKMYDSEGTYQKSFVDCVDFGSPRATSNNHGVLFDTGFDGSIYVTFRYQNRVERYTSHGKLLWKKSRPLSYKPGFQEGKSTTTRNMTQTTVKKNSPCAEGITSDDKGMAWVLTLNRQLKGRESIMVATWMTGKREVTRGDTSLRFTDAYKIEIFGSKGDLVDTIPLTQFADSIDIFGNNLFLIDKYRGMQVYQYRIISKK